MSVKQQFLNQKEVAQLLYVASLFHPTYPLEERQRGDVLAHILKTKTLESLSPTLRDFAFQLLADWFTEPQNRCILDSLLAQNEKQHKQDVFLKRLARFTQLIDRLFESFLEDKEIGWECKLLDGGMWLKVGK